MLPADPLPTTDSVPVSVKLLAALPPVPPAPTLEVPNPSLPATTTLQQDKTLKGQRDTSLFWEVTQAVIAVEVCTTACFTIIWKVVTGPTSADLPILLATMVGLVVGFYFSRTNHSAIGGIGTKANEGQQYLGR